MSCYLSRLSQKLMAFMIVLQRETQFSDKEYKQKCHLNGVCSRTFSLGFVDAWTPASSRLRIVRRLGEKIASVTVMASFVEVDQYEKPTTFIASPHPPDVAVPFVHCQPFLYLFTSRFLSTRSWSSWLCLTCVVANRDHRANCSTRDTDKANRNLRKIPSQNSRAH